MSACVYSHHACTTHELCWTALSTGSSPSPKNRTFRARSSHCRKILLPVVVVCLYTTLAILLLFTFSFSLSRTCPAMAKLVGFWLSVSLFPFFFAPSNLGYTNEVMIERRKHGRKTDWTSDVWSETGGSLEWRFVSFTGRRESTREIGCVVESAG